MSDENIVKLISSSSFEDFLLGIQFIEDKKKEWFEIYFSARAESEFSDYILNNKMDKLGSIRIECLKENETFKIWQGYSGNIYIKFK